jgi:hypothetical protein
VIPAQLPQFTVIFPATIPFRRQDRITRCRRSCSSPASVLVDARLIHDEERSLRESAALRAALRVAGERLTTRSASAVCSDYAPVFASREEYR